VHRIQASVNIGHRKAHRAPEGTATKTTTLSTSGTGAGHWKAHRAPEGTETRRESRATKRTPTRYRGLSERRGRAHLSPCEGRATGVCAAPDSGGRVLRTGAGPTTEVCVALILSTSGTGRHSHKNYHFVNIGHRKAQPQKLPLCQHRALEVMTVHRIQASVNIGHRRAHRAPEGTGGHRDAAGVTGD
jgi:hypothetical protein